VLVVEDEPSLLEMARDILQEAGYLVLEAESGKQALQVAEAHPGAVDVLLTDVMMPGMTGGQLAEQLRARRPGIGVVFMSGFTDASIDSGALPPGTRLLTKPFTSDHLLERLEQALGNR
jgi:CheY-like chemotaxis protein